MDIARPDLKRSRNRRRLFLSLAGLVVLAAITLGLARLEPAAPRVERTQVWTDTVKRGEMLRQVRGSGTLVPEQIQYVQVATDGRVERIFVLAGAAVQPDTLILYSAILNWNSKPSISSGSSKARKRRCASSRSNSRAIV